VNDEGFHSEAFSIIAGGFIRFIGWLDEAVVLGSYGAKMILCSDNACAVVSA
jgi:hypothetical protein